MKVSKASIIKDVNPATIRRWGEAELIPLTRKGRIFEVEMTEAELLAFQPPVNKGGRPKTKIPPLDKIRAELDGRFGEVARWCALPGNDYEPELIRARLNADNG